MPRSADPQAHPVPAYIGISGVFADLLISDPTEVIHAKIALPFYTAGALVKAMAALRGPRGELPFALLVLGPGRERSVHEEAWDAAHAALDTLAGLVATDQLGPTREAIAKRLSHLADVASRPVGAKERP